MKNQTKTKLNWNKNFQNKVGKNLISKISASQSKHKVWLCSLLLTQAITLAESEKVSLVIARCD